MTRWHTCRARSTPTAADKRLGLDQFASSIEVKKAYMKRSLLHHPDKQVGKSDAEKQAAVEEFKRLTEAYEILGDQPSARA